jgi:ferredoxin, 2Fe-2S
MKERDTLIELTFIDADGESRIIQAIPGESVMEAAIRSEVPGIEAACGGALACATCHAYLEEPWFSEVPDKTDTEADMLEYGSHVDARSRLTCQIEVTEALRGAVVRTPIEQG